MNLSDVGTIVDKLTKPIGDQIIDIDKSIVGNILDGIDLDEICGFGKSSSGIGFSVFSIFPSKKYCNCQNCTVRHRVKKYVFGGGAHMFQVGKKAINANGDIYFGRSFVNNNFVKVMVMGVTELSFGYKEYGEKIEIMRFGPALGMEIDLVLTPINIENDKPFYIMIGCRAMAGYSRTQGDINLDVLYANIKPKASFGFGF